MSHSISFEPDRPSPTSGNGRVHRLPPAEVTDEIEPVTDEPSTSSQQQTPRKRVKVPRIKNRRGWFGRKRKAPTLTVEQLAAWQEQKRALAAAAAADTGLAEVPDADEHLTAAANAKELRELHARNNQVRARAELERTEIELDIDNELAELAAKERAWHAKAQAHMHRVTDAASRVATLYRNKVWSGRVLNALIIGGVIWGAFNVRHNIAAGMAWYDLRSIFGLVLEPLASVLLILTMQAQQASTHGIRYAGRRFSGQWWAVVSFEAALVAALVVMNAGPHFGETFDRLLMWMTPPVLVAAGVLTKPRLVQHYERLIAAAMPQEAGRLDGDAKAIFDKMIDVEEALRRGAFEELDPDGLPSISAACKVIPSRKPVMQRAIDALRERQRRLGTTPDQQS